MYTRIIAVPIENTKAENRALFNELTKLFQKNPPFQGAMLRFCANDPEFFDRQGNFLVDKYSSNTFKEILESFSNKIFANDFAFAFPQGEKAREFMKNNVAAMEIAVRTLLVEPASISSIGYSVMAIKQDISNGVSQITSDLDEQQQIIDYIVNKLIPSDLKKFRQGNYNKIYKLAITGIGKEWLVAVRSPKTERERDNMGKGDPASFSIQLKTQASIYQDMIDIQESSPQRMYAHIPKPYFVSAFDKVMLMEFIDNSYNLDMLQKEIGYEALKDMAPEIYQRLKNTLDFWQTGNEGNVLFRHHDLHPGNVLISLNEDKNLKDVYIIDFDFSIYKPSIEKSNYFFEGIVSGQRVMLKYSKDTQCLNFLDPLLEP